MAAPAPAPLEFAFPEESATEIPAVSPTTPESKPEAEATNAPISFNFESGFDEDFLPSIDTEATPTAAASTEAAPIEVAPEPAASSIATPSTDKRTSQLDDFSLDSSDTTPLPSLEAPAAPETAPAPPSAAESPVVSAGFAGAMPTMPSAFDFDNFDLPAASSQPVTSIPVPPAPVVSTPPAAPVVSVASTPAPPSPSDNAPVTFGFDDANLASQAESAPQPAPTSSFDFSLDAPPTATAPTVPVSEPEIAPAAATAAVDDDFNLDNIFGEPAPAPAAHPAHFVPPLGGLLADENDDPNDPYAGVPDDRPVREVTGHTTKLHPLSKHWKKSNRHLWNQQSQHR